MSSIISNLCFICFSSVSDRTSTVNCVQCKHVFHANCAGSSDGQWVCVPCLEDQLVRATDVTTIQLNAFQVSSDAVIKEEYMTEDFFATQLAENTTEIIVKKENLIEGIDDMHDFSSATENPSYHHLYMPEFVDVNIEADDSDFKPEDDSDYKPEDDSDSDFNPESDDINYNLKECFKSSQKSKTTKTKHERRNSTKSRIKTTKVDSIGLRDIKHFKFLDEKQLKCLKCDKLFKSKFSLLEHGFVHIKDKPFKCSQCNLGFSHVSNRNRHFKRIHDRTNFKPKQTKCQFCGKLFQPDYLETHERTHTRIPKYFCNHCSSGFIRKDDLKKHIICDLLNLNVSRNLKLFVPCLVCNVEVLKCNLKRHMLIHKEARLLICKICGDSFKRKDSLLIHMRLHSGKKQFQCDICLKDFRVISNLYQHKRSKHGIHKTV